MRITKYTHACVRLEHGGRTLVIDPGVWSEDAALDGADAVLVTHEHGDHVDAARLAGRGIAVYAPAGAAVEGLEVTAVTPGEVFAAAGFPVRAVGGRHAYVYGEQPECANLGYLVDDALYHPGDSLHVPDGPVATLLVPAHASWLKTSEAIDFAKAVDPERAYPIHDAQVNERGLDGVNRWFGQEIGDRYRYLSPGETVTLE